MERQELLDKYKVERAEQTRLEVEAGRIRVFQNMAEGIVSQYAAKYGFDKCTLHPNGPDPRTWFVHAYFPNDAKPVVENFFDFPTPDLVVAMKFYREAKR